MNIMDIVEEWERSHNVISSTAAQKLFKAATDLVNNHNRRHRYKREALNIVPRKHCPCADCKPFRAIIEQVQT